MRTCDCGGWTDTWFARRGAVFFIAVNPGVRVEIEAQPAPASRLPVTLHAEDFGDCYSFMPGARPWGRHPLIEAAVEAVGVPEGLAAGIRVRSAVPPGASTGTSAAVCVALIGALRALAGEGVDADAVAAAAHAVEVERLGRQSGVQDQLAAAHGGVSYVEITDYPSSRVHALAVPERALAAIEDRMLLVFLGRTHDSSAIHEEVIRRLTAGSREGARALDALRDAAAAARDAALAGDLDRLGAAMQANTDAQRLLHPALVGTDARRVIAVASEHGATGWKVNGAGGEGGSLVLLCGAAPGARLALEAAVRSASPLYRVMPTTLARRGLVVTRASRDGGARA